MEKIVVLGSTGSIGTQSLNLIKKYNDKKVVALCCGSNLALLEKQIEEFKPLYVSTEKDNSELQKKFPHVEFYQGLDGIINIINKSDSTVVLNALVGSVGLVPTLEAIRNHKKVLLSNKETLVIGGEIVKEYLKKYNGTLYPIDSEHTGLWELTDKYKGDVKDYYITASGGAFRDFEFKDLKNKTVEDALSHPNWKMGKKITIDSATMMNKVFEVMEAHYLFDIDINDVHAVINRESIVHAFIKLKDESYRYAIGEVSMTNPIVRAMYYPEIRYEVKEEYQGFEFEEIKEEKHPLFFLGVEALKKGGVMPAILNAANEVAVELFLNSKIKYTEIYDIVSETLIKFNNNEVCSLENVLKYDKLVKEEIRKIYR